MKRILTFWLPISVVLLFLSFFIYHQIDKLTEIKTTYTKSDEEIYTALKEPLIGTVIYNGTTRHPDREGGQVFVYTFDGYMTNLPYRITLSRNVQFEDCAGCIGDWQEGMFSKPEYDTSYISLKEFIVQMVYKNDENRVATYKGNEARNSSVMIWKTKGFIWKITPTEKEKEYIIEASSLSGKKWKIRV
jgi:hypothetical protein